MSSELYGEELADAAGVDFTGPECGATGGPEHKWCGVHFDVTHHCALGAGHPMGDSVHVCDCGVDW